MQQQTAPELQRAFLSDIELAERYGVSRVTIWAWAKSGNLPQPIQLSAGCTRWSRSAVEASEAAKAKVAA